MGKIYLKESNGNLFRNSCNYGNVIFLETDKK